MKNLLTFCLSLALLLAVGLACQNNPLSRFSNQYQCRIEGAEQPKTSGEYAERGWKHLENDENDCAFGACSEAVRLDPQNAAGYACRGTSYKHRQQYEMALTDFNKAIELEPENFNIRLNRAILYEELEQYDKALDDMNAIINSKSLNKASDDFNLATRGRIYFLNGDYDKAAADLTEAINLKPTGKIYHDKNYMSYYDLRAEIYRRLGKMDLAEADELKANELENNEKIVSPSVSPTALTPPKTISGGVINGKAIELPKPEYPAAARAVGASGAVNVQVTVDESGKVISATAVSGHPLLRASAVKAAREAKFSPTLLSGKPVKLTGVIIYNFVP